MPKIDFEQVGLLMCQASVVAFALWSLFWVYKDAEKRGNLGCLMTVLILLSWPLGLVAWVILRPEISPEVKSSSMLINGESTQTNDAETTTLK